MGTTFKNLFNLIILLSLGYSEALLVPVEYVTIQEAINALDGQDNKEKAHALYNLGNMFYEKEAFEESIDLYKKALKLSPHDKDAQHNLELSKIMLQKQRQQKKQNNDKKNRNFHRWGMPR